VSVGPLQESGTTSGRGVADGNGPTDDDRFWGVLLTFNLPLGADPGRLGDRGGIGGGAPFRPPVVSKVALKALSLNHGCLNLVDP